MKRIFQTVAAECPMVQPVLGWVRWIPRGMPRGGSFHRTRGRLTASGDVPVFPGFYRLSSARTLLFNLST